MSIEDIPGNRLPLTVKILIVLDVLAAPALAMLFVKDGVFGFNNELVVFYLIDALVCGVCSWRVWRRQPHVTWILLAVLALTHLGMAYLIYGL